jgi:eukaryotic-like serine/threonine-protein kinase
VERRLATGGMAEVFIAWQLGPGGFERKVALKRLLPELAEDPRHAASLLDEARIAARLSHRNVAQIYEVGLEAGQHFIAMEFVDGPPLRALIAAARKRGEPVPLALWLEIAQSLLAALEHAHTVKDVQGESMGVVHRDVTPANLLVARTGEAKLVDFGLVLANTRLFRTQTGIARGTLPYMSPEQAAGELVDFRADLYSATATLYELLTLRRAFPEGPYVGEGPARASLTRPGLPVALDAVFARGFAASREGRPSSAAELSAEFTKAAGVTPASEAEVAVWVSALLVDVGELKPRSEEATRSVEAPTAPHRE